MQLKYGILADHVTGDENQKISAIGIFEFVNAQGFPTMVNQMVLVLHFEGLIEEAGQQNLLVELRDDDDNRIFGIEQEIALKANAGIRDFVTGTVIMRFNNLIFNKAGRYEFVIFNKDRFLGRVYFTIRKLEPQV